MDIFDKPKQSEDSSSFDCLPDEILIQIVGKLLDLKTLCLCEVVSKRFYRNVLQVEAISFTNPNVIDPPDIKGNITAPVAWLQSLRSAILSLKKFGRVKSLCIQLPSFGIHNDLLFKWKIKFGHKCDLFMCLSANSIYHKKESYVNENGHEQENMEMIRKSYNSALRLMMYVWMSHGMLWSYIENFPLLEEVSITDLEKRGTLSLGGGKIAEMRNCPNSPFETFEQRFMNHINLLWTNRQWNGFSLLELPISGYMMKGVSLILLKLNEVPHDNDDDEYSYNTVYRDDHDYADVVPSGTSNDFDDVVYDEAIVAILKENRNCIEYLMRSGTRILKEDRNRIEYVIG